MFMNMNGKDEVLKGGGKVSILLLETLKHTLISVRRRLYQPSCHPIKVATFTPVIRRVTMEWAAIFTVVDTAYTFHSFSKMLVQKRLHTTVEILF